MPVSHAGIERMELVRARIKRPHPEVTGAALCIESSRIDGGEGIHDLNERPLDEKKG